MRAGTPAAFRASQVPEVAKISMSMSAKLRAMKSDLNAAGKGVILCGIAICGLTSGSVCSSVWA